jgi:hypothetical protein
MSMSRKILIAKTWDGKPFKSAPMPYRIGFVINMTGDIVLEIDAPFFNDPPPPCEPGKYLDVYKHEVVEIFISAYPKDDDDAQFSPYLEIQIGPYGHYSMVFFLQEADFANKDTSLEVDKFAAPKINTQKGRWTAELSLPSFYLPEPACGDDLSITWMMNAFAMHGSGDEREYLAHAPVPGDKPNFHQLKAFVPLVLFETLETRMTIDRSYSMASEKIRMSSMAGITPAAAGPCVGGMGAVGGMGGGGGAVGGMGLSVGGSGGDVTSRLMRDVMQSPGGKKAAGIQCNDDEDDDGASTGTTTAILCVYVPFHLFRYILCVCWFGAHAILVPVASI